MWARAIAGPVLDERPIRLEVTQVGLDAIRLLDHLGIKQAHIIRYSMEAHIVARLLTTHPNRFVMATLDGAAGRFRWTAEDV